MELEVEAQKHIRPVHQCERVDCDNYLYGPIATVNMPSFETYECGECGEQYSWWKKNWPQYDVTFIIS